MYQKIMTAAVLAVSAGLIAAGPALAGSPDQTGETLPAPGVLGLVAIGVIGAIALARSRK